MTPRQIYTDFRAGDHIIVRVRGEGGDLIVGRITQVSNERSLKRGFYGLRDKDWTYGIVSGVNLLSQALGRTEDKCVFKKQNNILAVRNMIVTKKTADIIVEAFKNARKAKASDKGAAQHAKEVAVQLSMDPRTCLRTALASPSANGPLFDKYPEPRYSRPRKTFKDVLLDFQALSPADQKEMREVLWDMDPLLNDLDSIRRKGPSLEILQRGKPDTAAGLVLLGRFTLRRLAAQLEVIPDPRTAEGEDAQRVAAFMVLSTQQMAEALLPAVRKFLKG